MSVNAVAIGDCIIKTKKKFVLYNFYIIFFLFPQFLLNNCHSFKRGVCLKEEKIFDKNVNVNERRVPTENETFVAAGSSQVRVDAGQTSSLFSVST